MVRRASSGPIGVPRYAQLWLVAVLFFGIGDAASTSIGLGIPGISEGNPVVKPLVRRHGLVAIVGLKLVVFGGSYALWKLIPRPYCLGVPLGLSVMGVSVTVWNLGVLVTALAS